MEFKEGGATEGSDDVSPVANLKPCSLAVQLNSLMSVFISLQTQFPLLTGLCSALTIGQLSQFYL